MNSLPLSTEQTHHNTSHLVFQHFMKHRMCEGGRSSTSKEMFFYYVTCESSGGVGPSSEHFDWSVRIKHLDPLERRPLVTVSEAQLTFTVPARRKHFSLSYKHNSWIKKLKHFRIVNVVESRPTQTLTDLCRWACGFSHKPPDELSLILELKSNTGNVKKQTKQTKVAQQVSGLLILVSLKGIK